MHGPFTVVGIFCLIFADMTSASLAFSQAATYSPKAPTISDSALYQALFFQVVQHDRFVDHIESAGRDGSKIRSQIANKAGLTTQEQQLLTAIAKDWATATDAYSSPRAELVKMLQADPDQQTATVARLKALDMQQTAMTDDHINQLKNTFGPGRFQVLDAYVQSHYAPSTAHAGSASTTSSIPDTALYRWLFYSVVHHEKFGDRLDAMGEKVLTFDRR